MWNILTHNYIAKYNIITIILSTGLPHSTALEVEFLQIRVGFDAVPHRSLEFV